MKHIYLLTFFVFSLFVQQARAQGNETFETVPVSSPASSYGTRSWTGTSGVAWVATDARTDLTLNGKAILIRNGSLTAASIPNGIGNLSFVHQQEFTGSGSVLQVYVNDVLVGTANPSASVGTATFNNISVAGDAKLEIRQITSGLRIKIDDLIWTAAISTPCTTPGASAANLLFSNLTPNSVTASFSAAAPAADKYLFTYSTSSSPSITPFNGVKYNPGQTLGNSTVAGYGTALTYNLTGLIPGTTYYVFIYSANDLCSGGPLYLTGSSLSGTFSTPSLVPCTAPAAPTALIVNPFATAAAIAFSPSAPAATGYLMVTGTAPLTGFTPVNGTTYSVGQAAGNGTIGYIGATPAALLSGLTASTTYYVQIFAYNQGVCTGGPAYAATGLSGSFTTLSGDANIPVGYYDTLAGKTCADLKSALAWRLGHDLAKNPLSMRTYTDLWGQYLKSDVKPREVGTGSPLVIWDMYSDNPSGPDPYNFTPGAVADGGQQDNGGNAATEGVFYNREHSVPLNWFSGNTGNPGPATDYHHIYPTDKWVNALRDSYIYGEVTNPTTTTLNGSKLGPNAFSGLSGTAFEPINAYKGDFARAFLYFVTRYQSNMPGWSGGFNGTAAFEQNTYPSVDIPYLRLMMKWHNQDPVSDKERNRNDSAYVFQGNRNPFVDLPALVDLVWNESCGLVLPLKLVYFKGTQRGNLVQLDWQLARGDNPVSFEVERSQDGRTFSRIGEVVYQNGRLQYGWEDNIEKLGARRLYYRLKANYTGKPADYSDIFTIHVGTNVRFTVFPDPASNRIIVDFGNKSFTGELRIANVHGATVVSQKLTNAIGRIEIKTPALSSGRYAVQAVREGESPAVQSFILLR